MSHAHKSLFVVGLIGAVSCIGIPTPDGPEDQSGDSPGENADEKADSVEPPHDVDPQQSAGEIVVLVPVQTGDCAIDTDCAEGYCGFEDVCVQCLFDGHCDADAVCSLAGLCVECARDDDCSSSEICSPDGGCVDCVVDDDCDSDEQCDLDGDCVDR